MYTVYVNYNLRGLYICKLVMYPSTKLNIIWIILQSNYTHIKLNVTKVAHGIKFWVPATWHDTTDEHKTRDTIDNVAFSH